MKTRLLAVIGVLGAAALVLAFTILNPRQQGTQGTGGRHRRARATASAASTASMTTTPTASIQAPNLATQGNLGRLTTLPAWFLSSRVHLNTGAQTNMFDPEAVAARVASLGATVVTMTVKEKAGDPAWPSAVPAAASALRSQANRVEPVASALHRRGIRLIGYYFGSTDQTIARTLPQAVCKSPNGKPLLYKEEKGFKNVPWLDMTDPAYRDIIKQRLLEMAAMGVDGYNFDETHLPLEGCYGTAVEQAWRAATGRAAPSGGRRNADRGAYIEFQSRQMEETFGYWQQAVHAQYPNVVFVVSTHALARPLDDAVNSDFARVVDVQKNEVTQPLRSGHGIPNVFARGGVAAPDAATLLGFGWAWLRDAADGRPPRLWHPHFDDEARAEQTAQAVVGYGGIFALAMNADELKGTGDVAWQTRLLQWGQKMAPYIDAPPMRWAAVQFSEAARDGYGTNRGQAWKDAAGPAVAAFGAFVRAGVPVAVLADAQLDDSRLAAYHVLALTRQDALSAPERAAVDRFRQRGGVVVNVGALGGGSFESAIAAVRSQIASATATAPIQFTSGTNSQAHVIGYADASQNRWVVAVLNDFGWLSTLSPEGDRRSMARAAPTSVSLVLRTSRPVTRAYDLVSGQQISVSRSGSATTLNLPNLAQAAYVVVEF